MGLSASMWTGVSGLLAHGERMNVIGNNIANVNTVGFKGQRMDFEDFIYQNSFSSAGITQIGRGVSVGAVMGDFDQGSFEKTTSPTDLAIGGRGFFKVKPAGTDQEYFTRAGNFSFNKEGYLNDPNGFTLQGWKIDNTTGPTRASGGLVPSTNASQIKGSGVPTDVKLDKWSVDPLQTTKISFDMNLSSKGADKAQDPTKPFYSMMEVWNGTQPPKPNTPYLPDDAFSGTPATITVYDEAGATHVLTIYFDQVSPNSYTGGADGERMWEYIVTMKPSEDMRKIAVPTDPAAYLANPNTYAGGYEYKDMKETKDAGLLMSGTLTFDSAGKLKDQTAYVLNGNRKTVTVGNPPVVQAGNGYALDPDGNPVPILDPESTANYMRPTEVSTSGFPMLVPNFTGIPGANTVGSVPDADKYLMEVDFGLKVSDFTAPWVNPNSTLADSGYNKAANVNPMDPASAAGATAWKNARTPANNLPFANLGPTDIVSNAGGTPRYYYNNPSYVATDPGSPPYIYDTEANYTAAYNAALTAAGGAGHEADITAAHWPKTNLKAATPVSSANLSGIKPPAYRQNNAFTSYDGTDNTTKSASQNGYGFGDLTTYMVDGNGILSGVYSNGVTLPLYQIALYDFTNKQGLRREGGNLFSQTLASGDPASAAAGTSGFGTVNAQSLEGSNVDLSREFVTMITTQRGFQSNSKVITTVDSMLEVVVSMKR